MHHKEHWRKKVLEHTYPGEMSEYKPENYATNSYTLTKEDNETLLSLSKNNDENQKAKETSI